MRVHCRLLPWRFRTNPTAFAATAMAMLLGAGTPAVAQPQPAATATASASAAAATPAPPPCPAPGAPPVEVTLTRGYQAIRNVESTAGVPCTVVMIPKAGPTPTPGATPAPGSAGVSSDVTLSFSKGGLELHYLLRQQPGLHTEVQFPRITLASDDHISIEIRARDDRPNLFIAEANPLALCSSITTVPGNLAQHQQCKAVRDDPQAPLPGPATCCWNGKLTIPYAILSALRIPHEFFVEVRRTVKVDHGVPLFYVSGRSDVPVPVEAAIPVRLNTRDVANQERYVSVAPDIGFNPSVPPHRIPSLVYFPLDVHDAFVTAASDDAGPLLSKRDKTLKDILPKEQLAAFKCVSCGSFQTFRTTVFDPLATSGDVLGVDFSDLGVDSVPFSFNAAGFPVDSGYEGLFADESLGFAVLNGTTKSNGTARDSVLRAVRRFDWNTKFGTETLRVGMYHVVANRSAFVPAPTSTYVPLPFPQQHTTNTQGSIGYSYSNSPNPDTDRNVTTLSALLRYGTQYLRAGQRLDAAVSIAVAQPFENLRRQPVSLPLWSAAFGYRNLGPAYSPLDGEFDPLSGLHGFYGKVAFSEPNKTVAGLGAASLTVHRFSDAVEPRDTLLTASGLVRLGKANHFALTGGVTVASLTVSQAGHLFGTPIVVRDDQRGTDYLPNGNYSISLTSTSKNHQASIGYTQGMSQNCDVKRAPPPCYAYRQPSVTASLFWLPFTDLFVTGTMKNQNDTALDLMPSPLSQGSLSPSRQETTAGHIVRNAALGAYLFKGKCSTLILSTENRGGSFDDFAKTAPKPGFTNTAAVELVPAKAWPALMIAYSRQGTLGSAPSRQFLARIRFGLPKPAFRTDIRSACAQR